MRLIEEIDGIKFYDGIDIEYIRNYNGEKLIVIFIDNWNDEVLIQKRDSAINSILGEEGFDLNNLKNNYISIYQTNGHLEPVYEAIKKKILCKDNGRWYSVAGFAKIKF
jgi:hypothetical protein